MKIFAIILPLLILSSCTTVKETVSADGEKAFALSCSGEIGGWDDCYVAAGKACGDAGYKVLEKSSEDTASIGGGMHGFYGSQSQSRTMLITCKKVK